MNSSYDSDDTIIDQLKHEFWFGFILLIIMIMSLIAISLSILFASVTWNFTVYHTNLRILLLNVCVCVIWTCTGQFVTSAYVFFSIYASSDPYSYLNTSTSKCKTVSALSVAFPSSALSLGVLTVGLERTYGLISYRTYHKRTKRSLWLSAILVILFNWTPSAVPQISNSFTSNHTVGTKIIPICMNLMTFTRTQSTTYLCAFISLQFLSAIIWILVYSFGRRLLTKISINRAQKSLAARFQLSQNFGVIRTLSPWVVLHVAYHSLIFALQWMIADQSILNLHEPNRFIFMYATYLIQIVYSVAFPSVCVARSAVLRTRFVKTVANLRRKLGIPRRPNTVQPGPSMRLDKDISANGFHMTEIRTISYNLNGNSKSVSNKKTGQKKRLQRIHVFSPLE